MKVRANTICTYGGIRRRKGETFDFDGSEKELPKWMDKVTPELLKQVEELEKAEDIWGQQKTAVAMSDITRGRVGKPV